VSLGSCFRGGLATLAFAVSAVGLCGCGATDAPLPLTTPGPSASTGEARTNANLSVGDCVHGAVDPLETTLTASSCDELHDYEVFAVLELSDLFPGADFPGDDAVTTEAERGCGAAFEPFTGTAYDHSRFDFSYVAPTADDWHEAAARHVACLIGDPAGPVTGSLAKAEQPRVQASTP
jgi:hypothetical protein